jgi:rubrerythrin
LNQIARPKSKIEDHLHIHGMASTYTTWIHHGEAQFDTVINQQADHLEEQYCMNEDISLNESENIQDRLSDMVRELFTAGEEGAHKSMFAAVLEDIEQELHPGASYTRFSFVVKLLHIKSFYQINNVAFSAILKLLSLAFLQCCLPASYKEAKKLIKALGLGYESIHVCPNNCVLFHKDYEKNNECPVCGASRWKDGDARNKSPQKVLRHFPLNPRLRRMFATAKISEEAQWHKLKRKEVENELSHPADGEAWKDFDRKHNWFQEDPRNIRLGLAIDGFNPFGKMSSSYSMWPVFAIPYNFPPWVCMEQSNFMLCLLIPGRECPGKDFDVFLEPLVDELQELWLGVSTFDALSRKDFNLHAAVIWCIHDYPGLSTLSSRVTRGYYACVHCDKDPCSRRIRNKICCIGHRCWLPHDHPWRKKKDYDGQIENRDKPQQFSTTELMQQLERVKEVKPGKHPNNNKRKRDANGGQCWKGRSCLWDLPYWTDLKLRHKLDVMHIEKIYVSTF